VAKRNHSSSTRGGGGPLLSPLPEGDEAGRDGEALVAVAVVAKGRAFWIPAFAGMTDSRGTIRASAGVTRSLVVVAGRRRRRSREALRQQRIWAGRVGTANAGVPALASPVAGLRSERD